MDLLLRTATWKQMIYFLTSANTCRTVDWAEQLILLIFFNQRSESDCRTIQVESTRNGFCNLYYFVFKYSVAPPPRRSDISLIDIVLSVIISDGKYCLVCRDNTESRYVSIITDDFCFLAEIRKNKNEYKWLKP